MSAHSYGTVHRILHWSTAALVFLTIPVAIAMTSEGFRAIGNVLYVTHKGAGIVIFVLVAVRLAAVAHHALVLKDGVARRMWPPVAAGSAVEHDRGPDRSGDVEVPQERT